jgi:hypothetical protein
MDVKPKRITEVQLQVSSPIKESFRKYCKEQEVNMKDGLNEILNFITKNKIGLGELEHLMDRNLTKEVMRYHNYTVGFLKEYEYKQMELMKKLIRIIEGEGAGDSKILKVFMQEILVNTQEILSSSSNKEGFKQMLERNETNIKEALNDNEN